MKLTNRQAKTLKRWLTLFGSTKPTEFQYFRVFNGFKLQVTWEDAHHTKSQLELQMPFATIEKLKDGETYTIAELCGEEEG